MRHKCKEDMKNTVKTSNMNKWMFKRRKEPSGCIRKAIPETCST